MKTKIYIPYILTVLLAFLSIGTYAQVKYKGVAQIPPGMVPNKLPNDIMPVFGVWVWGENELKQDGFKSSIDKAATHSPFNFIIPFLRFPDKEVVDAEIHDQVKKAAEYAAQNNMALVPDLDIRSARRAYQKEHPDELQQMLRIKEIELSQADSLDVTIPSIGLNDHYSGGNIPHHNALKGEFLRCYAYKSVSEGIDELSINDITSRCRVVYANKDSIKVRVPSSATTIQGQSHAGVMVAFTHLYPDIFGPHIMEFQQNIIRQYADVKAAGVCKDEWGFPPYYPRFYRQGFHDFWYSQFRAAMYAERTGGRELLFDCFLMAFPVSGKESLRQMAVNHFMCMSTERNTVLETDFYNTTKEVFGPDAAVTVHSTWWPYPDKCEFMKNGLDWWTTKRDWAQTDEVAPYAVRTALCKKWGSAIWYNMYYKADLGVQIWSSALGGGRIDYLSYHSLYNKKFMQAENRIRMLNYITESPLDCRVAVLFGHAAAMNWAGPHYDDVGMGLIDSLWHQGYPADLIPTSEIWNQSIKVDAEGYIVYGMQRYNAVVLYHPEFENKEMAEFFNQVKPGKTALYRVGEWSKDFNGNELDTKAMLPEMMIASDDPVMIWNALLQQLKTDHIPSVTPATFVIDNKFFGLRDFPHASYAPANSGFSRLIDGTHIQIAATQDVSGDTIQTMFKLQNKDVAIDAVGIFAVRLNEKGELSALAAGGLKYFKTGTFEIRLDERTDIALWMDKNGKWKGVVQGEQAGIPKSLTRITRNWTFIQAPLP